MMAAAGQSGIDILCDAAGSDLLMTSLFGLATPEQSSSSSASKSPERKRVRVREDGGRGSVGAEGRPPVHVCHICKRIYERADHLLRHLRSHENARQYQCSRCPKRFNRADLVTRHETTHDRDKEGNRRRPIRRSDRAAEACLACAASKAKCDDQKPCGRCRNKNLLCETSTKRALRHNSSSEVHTFSSPETEDISSEIAVGGSSCPIDPELENVANDSSHVLVSGMDGINDPTYMMDMLGQPGSMGDGMMDNMVYFNPVHNLFQDIDFTTSWDLSFDSFTIPQLDVQEPSPQSATSSISKPSHRHHTRDPCRGHAAFKRSPWLWEPKNKEDYVLREKEHLQINEKMIACAPALERLSENPARKMKMSLTTRDRLFSIVLAQHKDPLKVPSFPSLELLNYLMQAHFVQDDSKYDSWIHASSFDPDGTSPELLGAVVSSGATFISVPAIWQFGLALQEVIRLGIANVFELNNNATRDLKNLQAFMLHLDVGIWSGFKRKMEIAESFVQPLLTMLRRGGTFSALVDMPSLFPSELDTADVIEAKWRKFVEHESFKRLSLHLFFHDTQASVGIQKNPLMSFTELNFSLPASRDLWRAPSATAWREVYLRKKPMLDGRQMPRVSEVMHSISLLDELAEHIDEELCYGALLHGFWGQIAAYREAVRFYADNGTNKRNATHYLWLKSQHQELYRDLSDFSTIIYTSQKSNPNLAVILELFMMILHVWPDELQRFAGKGGEEEAGRAAASLEEHWARSPEARYAVWHAGQVFRNARQMPPTSLRGFNAIAVYFASLTLWIYGLLSCSQPDRKQEITSGGRGSELVLVDGEENRDTKAFVQLDRGVPGLMLSGEADAGVEALSNPSATLSIARNVFRENFPIRSEPLPPLVESLGNLLRDLGSGAGGRPSRVASRAVSESPL